MKGNEFTDALKDIGGSGVLRDVITKVQGDMSPAGRAWDLLVEAQNNGWVNDTIGVLSYIHLTQNYYQGESVSYEYDPSGEPDIISEDDQKLLDYFNSLEKGKEAYGEREEYEELKKADISGLTDEELTGYFERIDELRISLGEAKAKEVNYDNAASWWRDLSQSDKKFVLDGYIFADLTGTEDGLDWDQLPADVQDEVEDYFGEKIFSQYHGESYANEEDIFTWISTKLGLKPRKQTTYGPKEIPDNRPKEKPMLCSPSEIYDHKSGKCIPKYMAPWKLRNEVYEKESYAKEIRCKSVSQDRCVKEEGHSGLHMDKNWLMWHPMKNESYAKEGEIYNWMERKVDPDQQGADVINANFYDQLLNETAEKFGITIDEAEKIWDSAGADESYGNEEIIEKKFTPPKILYYKQYPLGRRANVKSHFGKEVSLRTLKEAENWYGQVRVKQGYPAWNTMNIINKQRAISDYLRTTVFRESYAKEYIEIEEWWTRLGNSERFELLEKHGYSQSNNFYEDWRFEDLPDTLQDGLSLEYYNDDGSVNESYTKEQNGGAGGAGGNGAGATTGNGGEPAPTNGNGEPEEEEPSRRRAFFGYGRYRNCPKGQVYRDGKCVDEANEGGRGSGKRGHSGWMKSLEEASDYKECPNCKVMTEQYGGKCQLCGKKV